MITADLPALPPGAERIPFALASAQQVVQALAYATERLAAHFPTLDWATWNDTFRHVQPELVVQGPTVWLEWPALARLVQQLASSLACSLLDPHGYGPAVTEAAVLLSAYQSLAQQALAQSTETPGCIPLLDELAPMLAKGHAIASRVCAATHEPADEAQRPDPLVPDQQPTSAAPEPPTVGLSAEEAIVPNPPAPPAPAPPAPAPPAPAPASEESPSTVRRTFRDIVQHHPRANSKMGFTVRELCRAMRISAASLQEAHANPGRLSLTAVSALATLMQESLLSVLADLMAGAGTRKKRRNRGRAQQG